MSVTGAIPVKTYQAARKVYNLQNIYIRIGDQLKDILAQIHLSRLNPVAGVPSDAVFRLALVTAFQYAESLADAGAFECTLKRIDWKYALYLPVNYPGIAAHALCEFRRSMLAYPQALAEFGSLVNALADRGLFDPAQRESLDPRHILFAVCETNRLHHMDQAMRSTLSLFASTSPEWVKQNMPPHWYERYRPYGGVVGCPPNVLQDEQRLIADIERLLELLSQKELLSAIEQAEMHSLSGWLGNHAGYFPDRSPLQSRCEHCLLPKRGADLA